MSKTLKEIKDEYARSFAYKDWQEFKSRESVLKIAQAHDEVAERYAQSQTQELQEQNVELARMLLKCQVLCEILKVNVVEKEIEELLTKYNHLDQKP